MTKGYAVLSTTVMDDGLPWTDRSLRSEALTRLSKQDGLRAHVVTWRAWDEHSHLHGFGIYPISAKNDIAPARYFKRVGSGDDWFASPEITGAILLSLVRRALDSVVFDPGADGALIRATLIFEASAAWERQKTYMQRDHLKVHDKVRFRRQWAAAEKRMT